MPKPEQIESAAFTTFPAGENEDERRARLTNLLSLLKDRSATMKAEAEMKKRQNEETESDESGQFPVEDPPPQEGDVPFWELSREEQMKFAAAWQKANPKK